MGLKEGGRTRILPTNAPQEKRRDDRRFSCVLTGGTHAHGIRPTFGRGSSGIFNTWFYVCCAVSIRVIRRADIAYKSRVYPAECLHARGGLRRLDQGWGVMPRHVDESKELNMLKAALERDTQNRPFEKSIKQFGEIVMAEPALLAKLEETRDANSFIATYCKLASETGIHFTPDDMRIVAQEQKQGSNWVIPKAVLNIVRERF